MGRRGNDLTPEMQKIILDLSNESYSGHNISQVVVVIPRTVSKFENVFVREETRKTSPDQADREKRTHEVTKDFFGWSGKTEGKH
jgi:hypothetical protein